jgi:hypothetical protein
MSWEPLQTLHTVPWVFRGACSKRGARWIMATRCDCHWVSVSIHEAVEMLWLREDEVSGCPAHTAVREGTDTKT